VRVAGVLGIVPAYVSLGILHFQRKQIGLVEEENDGDALEGSVVDYRVENIFRLFEAIRSTTKNEEVKFMRIVNIFKIRIEILNLNLLNISNNQFRKMCVITLISELWWLLSDRS
jgi:hypothetical protein